MIRIEAASPPDAADLSHLAGATFPLACPPHITAEAIREFVEANLGEPAFLDYMRDPAYDVIVARDEDGDTLVGYALTVRRQPAREIAALLPPGPVTELSKLYVHPDAHGSGLARLLLAAALDGARSAGTPTMWLGTNGGNARARRFYEKEGFSLVGTRRFLVGGNWEDDVVYARAV